MLPTVTTRGNQSKSKCEQPGHRSDLGEGTTESSPSDELEELRKTVAALRAAQTKSNKKLQEVIDSQNFMSDKYDELMLKLEDMCEVKNKVVQLEKTLIEKDKILIEQAKEIERMKEGARSVEQYQRRRQLEIHGIQQEPNENLEEILINITSQIGITLEASEIDVIHRLPSRFQKINPVIVELRTRKVRDLILAKKSKKKMNDGLGNQVYIFESLSPYFKNLLWQTRTVAKQKQYNFTYFRKNAILVKKTQDSNDIIKVETVKDLANIV